MGNIFSISVSVDRRICSGWDCVFRHANYVHRLPEDLAALQSACGRLTEVRNDVKRQVDMAEREQLQPLQQVLGWLSRVEALKTKVDQLIRDGTGDLQQKCLGGCCPRHCRTLYKLGKTVAKMLQDVDKLMREKPHGVVAERLPPPSISEMPSEATVGMDSRLDQVWRCLHEEQVGILGLYGLGGVGKTTLLTQLNNAFTERTHDLDFVIWATASRNVDLEKIQDDIWEKIGFCGEQWKSRTREAKARCIWNVLNKKRFVLMLDDIWERLNLLELGVPFQNKKNKIVFTTRSEEVCGEMEADWKIKVECLTWKESWDLFQMKVGEDALNSHHEIPQLAQVVARECCGLPLVLATMGRAMACKKTPQEWRHTVNVLQNSASNFPGMGDRVFPLLKYTYDSLLTEPARQCFLSCSLYPEDFMIAKHCLIGRWICEGLLDGYDDIETAINHGFNIIGNLIRACLLEETNDHFCVKMHDVIRDLALWIACERAQNGNLVKAGCGLTEAPPVDRWMDPKRISLMSNQIEQLIGSPNCPNLVTLFLDGNPLKMITDGFFRFMPNLKVLSLSNIGITDLPREISNLVSLQYLDLSRNPIRELPIELKNLEELKTLVLHSMPHYFSIREQLISSLSKLQTFHVFRHGISDGTILKDNVLSYENNEGLVEELESLKYLQYLAVPITNEFAFKRLLRSNKLCNCISKLYLQNFNTSISLNIASLNNAKRLSCLSITNCGSLDYLDIDVAWAGQETMESNYFNSSICFYSLEYVEIFECQKLKDLTWLVFAPNLKFLGLRRCDQMREVVSSHKCVDSVENGESLSPFATLRELVLDDLPLLKSIFWKALPLACLITMRVFNCPLLKKLPLNSSSAKGNRIRIAIYGNNEWWNELEWEDEATHNALLPCFINVEEEQGPAAIGEGAAIQFKVGPFKNLVTSS